MKIALAQINPTIGDIKGNREKIIEYINSAKESHADLIVFPELAVIGYPPLDLLMNKKIVDDNINSVEEIAKRSAGIAVICGYVEHDLDNSGMMYNAAAFMEHGAIRSKHFKTLLPDYDVFDETRYFSPAPRIEPVNFKGKKIGITICEDIYNDKNYGSEKSLIIGRNYKTDPVDILAAEKIDILINISASPFVAGKNKIKRELISYIAEKKNLFVIYLNQVGGNDSLIFDGNSFAVNKNGGFAALAKSYEEDLIIVNDDAEAALSMPEEREEGMEDIRQALVLGLRDYVHKCGFKSALIGLSGGIDSALTAVLAVDALGPDNVLTITMPSAYSSKGSIDDSVKLAENLGIRIENLPITNLFAGYKKTLSPIFKGLAEDVTEENIQARIRGSLLMAASNKFGSLLLTTGNKSELAMGYCTIYGDMAGGLAVISDLPKTIVFKMAAHINRKAGREIIPPEIISKAPSAELRENQKDEDTLPPYDILDGILARYIEKHMSADQIIKEGFDPETVIGVLRAVNNNEYKRRQAPPGLKVTTKAFGFGRRIPIAQKFIP